MVMDDSVGLDDDGLSSCSAWHMPAEWDPHRACLLLYPHNPATFRDGCRPAQREFLAVCRAIAGAGGETVLLCAPEGAEIDLNFDSGDENIRVCTVESDDTWARDTGPTFLTTTRDPTSSSSTTTKLRSADWGFNAYGGLYPSWERDQQLCRRMGDIVARHYCDVTVDNVDYHTRLVLEGGSFHVDGEGTVLTTEECLLQPNRNPHLTRGAIESILLEALGATRVLWLPHGLCHDDDTNGHVDNLACFVAPGHVVLAWTDDKDDPQYARSAAALDVLEQATDARGRNITVTKLHVPPPMYYTEEDLASYDDPDHGRTQGERAAASYVNFYIANDAVIVPGFGSEEYDARAVKTLTSLFAPKRRIVQVQSREILLGGGNIHCITQQVPL